MNFSNGMMSVLVSVVILQLFQEKFNASNRVLKRASAAAYTVYLIHNPFIIPFGVHFYVKLLEVLGVHAVSGSFATILLTDKAIYMWLGLAFTSFVACGVFLWPVAFLLAKTPGFRQVL